MADKPPVLYSADKILTPEIQDKISEIDNPVLLCRVADWLDELANYVEEQPSESGPDYTVHQASALELVWAACPDVSRLYLSACLAGA